MFGFKRKEVRASGDNYAEMRTGEFQREAEGRNGKPELLASVQACVALWEHSLASATVEPASTALHGVCPRFLGLVGRMLALKGDFVALIEVQDGMVYLRPASQHEVYGDFRTWTYWLYLDGPTAGTHTARVSADEVVHFRIGADTTRPWEGVGALKLSKDSAGAASAIESAIVEELKLPIGRVAPFAGVPAQIESYGDRLRRGGLTAAVDSGAATGARSTGASLTPHAYGPEPGEPMRALRRDLRDEMASLFGIPATLFDPRGEGSSAREGWRRWWVGTMAPVALMVQDELKMKLDPAATVGLGALRASDEDGRSRAISRRATAAQTFMAAGIERDEALRLAGIDRTLAEHPDSM